MQHVSSQGKSLREGKGAQVKMVVITEPGDKSTSDKTSCMQSLSLKAQIVIKKISPLGLRCNGTKKVIFGNILYIKSIWGYIYKEFGLRFIWKLEFFMECFFI